jgi:hypothetical protein
MRTELCALVCAIMYAGCGNNLAGPAGTSSLQAPSSLEAFSLDSAHVGLTWASSASASDTTLAGYILSWGPVTDTLPRLADRFTAGPLARGATTFSIRSLLKSGKTSGAATITWAPAWRFDAVPIIVTEYFPSQQTGFPGVDAGTGTTDPKAVGLLDADADSTLDFYLAGPAGSPLQLQSAVAYSPGWHQTLFSTQATPWSDLNAPLATFPQDNTFTLQNVTLTDNVIYYMKTQGNTGEINYVRVHVHFLPGSSPGRQVEIRISLQKVSRLLYA